MTSSALTAVILAAGEGKRMKSARPKVLHELCGRPMVHYVVDAAMRAGATDVVVVIGHGGEEVSASLTKAYGDRVRTAVQATQRGTGDAVMCAMPYIKKDVPSVLLLCGDTPLLDARELGRLCSTRKDAAVAMLTAVLEDATGYGRVLRDKEGKVVGIREHKDASEHERAIREINPAVYVAELGFLQNALRGLTTDNAQGELYLTDIVEQAAKVGEVVTIQTEDHGCLVGINDRAQLAVAEDVLYRRIADEFRRRGATIRTSARIDAMVEIEQDATIEHGVVLRGKTRIGSGARIDVGSVLTDVDVETEAWVKPYTVASESTIGGAAQIGPFSHLRPNSRIEAEAHIGNFVETKKTIVRRGAKANHLAYLGDGDIGEKANIGAGTIFCNYDGFKKHKTEIGAGAFVGSDSQMVAPVKVGEGAYVATGTTVTRDVPKDALAIGRVKQENKEGYASRLKTRLKGG